MKKIFNTQLSSFEMTEVKQLKETVERQRTCWFKLEPDFLHQANRRSQHFLYYQENTLLAYAFLNFFDSQVLEATLIVQENELIADSLVALNDFARQQAIPTVLIITDINDQLLSTFLKNEQSYVHQFSEYRLFLDSSNFNAQQEVLPLRHAKVEESLQIARLLAEMPEDEIEPLLPKDLANTLVLTKEDRVIACIRIDESPKTYGIYGFVVDPDHRGRGLGQSILTTVIQQLLAKKQKEIYLEVEATNQRALHLYTKLGFRKEILFDYYCHEV
ncbi:acetyltransferase [Enterococcus durans]|uniref:GNAT family N-acetyltransferase n=1 Tax=Enterococcus durans TaxID=53345 RepID=UPI000E07E9C5|nr:GNAT family N-acetyltransferase [Enterococcus durans]MDB1684107.1 GNAT family N-acetyltransferase [Enterococcus durans]STP39736.1 acetyltransferase [Enterococcus durans]